MAGKKAGHRHQVDLDRCGGLAAGEAVTMRHNPPSGWLTLICAKTGNEIDTRVRYSCADLERVKTAKLLLHCKLCGEAHLFFFADARLAPIRSENFPKDGILE
jgi:hypothetical protein